MSPRALMLLTGLMAGLGNPPSAEARQAVSSLKPLLVEALKKGKAAGILDNPDARAFNKTFGASGPILVDVTRVGDHREPGCGRLEVTTRQTGVVERDAKGVAQAAQDQRLVYQVNYCASGRFPIGEEGR